MSTTSSSTSGSHFFSITKSSSVPDIHKKTSDESTEAAANLLATNSGSVESAIASPANSLEQFEVNTTLPLTPDDPNYSIADTLRYCLFVGNYLRNK